MGEREAFVRRVCETPTDDTARLVFADWLDDQGNERDAWRAAMIRGQWDAAGPSRWITTFPDVADLAMYLRANVWVDGFDRTDIRDARQSVLHVRGGFLEAIALPTEAFIRPEVLSIFATHPVTAVRLTDRVPLHLPAVYEGRRVRPADQWELHGTVHWFRVDPAGVPWGVWNHWRAAADIGAVFDPLPERGRARVFDSPDDAGDWLSSLCVACGRCSAGLPVLCGSA